MHSKSFSPEHRAQLRRWWGWLLLTTVVFALLIASRYFAVADIDGSPTSLLFRGAMLLAHFATLATLLLVPVLLVALFVPRPVLVIPFGVLCSAAILCALLVDTQVFQLYRFHINAGVVNLLFGGAAGETFRFSGIMYLQAAVIAAGVLLVQSLAAAFWWRYVRNQPGSRAIARAVVAVLLVATIGFHGVHIWADVVGREAVLEQTTVLPLRYAATAKRRLRKLGVNVRSRPVLLASARHDRSGLSYPLQPLDCRAPADPPNIILILIDSWRFDALNARVTPNIDAFARRAVRFTDHYSGGNATRIGVFSLFYSIPGTYWHRVLAEREPPVFIAELLRQGYDVRAFRGAPLYSPEFDRTIFAPVAGVRLRSQGAGPADWDRDLTNDFLSYLDSRRAGTPFFALVFYDSPHSFQFPSGFPLVFQPSTPDVNYLRLREDTPVQPFLNRYLNSVRYVDGLVGEALEAIEKRGLLDDSVVIVTSDHGQEFNDTGYNYWGHGSNFTRYQTGVPFLLYAPGLAPGIHRHRTTHFDVMPTVMREYLGCQEPFRTHSVGRPLFEPGGRETLVMSEYADFAIIHGDRMAVIREQGMEVRGAGYAKEPGRLDPDAIAEALEQKTRFYGATGAEHLR